MKYKISKNIYLFASAFIGLVGIYIGFTILRRTHEGLSDGASTTNDAVIAKSTAYDTTTTQILAKLTSSPLSYINLLTSYKNNRMANIIQTIVNNKNSNSITNISDYDELIVYLQTLGVSDTTQTDSSIDAIVQANNKNTSDILFKLSADNQAYIDLLTSYKNNSMAKKITELATSNTPNLQISEIDPSIDYLRTLAGITESTKPYVPTTRNISLSSNYK